MEFSCLASGSSGNCFYVEEGKDSFLFDVGISAKQVVERLSFLGRDIGNLKGIFVSHEHTDHIRGVDVLARKLNIPIFTTKGTAKNSFLCSQTNLINTLGLKDIFTFNNLKIRLVSKSHDAEEPVSFIVESNKKTLSILTDIGYGCKNIIDAISKSDSIILESNHDIDLLKNGKYPYFLKKRILSEKGHLSNFNAGLLLLEHAKSQLNNVVLSHLSQENNTPDLAMDTISNLIKERKDLSPKISLSGRKTPSSLFKI